MISAYLMCCKAQLLQQSYNMHFGGYLITHFPFFKPKQQTSATETMRHILLVAITILSCSLSCHLLFPMHYHLCGHIREAYHLLGGQQPS